MTSPSDFFVDSLPAGSTPADLDATVGVIDPQDFRAAEAFVYRVDFEFLQRLASSPELSFRESAIHRLVGKPLYVTAYDSAQAVHVIKRVQPRGLRRPKSERQLLSHVRTADLRRLVTAAGASCFHRFSDTYHFVSPSDLHCSLFLRIGDVVDSRDALEASAFWLLPIVAVSDAVLLDTWGVTPILQECSFRMQKVIEWDALRFHPSYDRHAARESLNGLLSKVPRGGRITFLESLHISGRMWSLMRLIFEELRHHDIDLQAHAIYRFQNSDASVEALCEIEDPIEKYEPGETCKMCATGSKPFRIDPKVYYLREIHQTPVFLHQRHYAVGRDFATTYREVVEAFRVHRLDPNDRRHHAFDIDVLTLLADHTFLERYQQQLKAIQPTPDVIIVPKHTPGIKLGQIAAQHFERPLIVQRDLRPAAGLRREDRDRIKSADHILIIDDVSNSGSTLKEYNKALREGGYAPFKSVAYLVGVARPQSEKEWNELTRSLTKHHDWQASLKCVEKIFLPHWKVDECPWCKEETFLASVANKFPSAPKWISDRISHLADKERGLNQNVFLSIPSLEVASLGASSDFGPEGLNPIITLFSVVSALQELRNDSDQRTQLSPDFPHFRVFDMEKCLVRYDEALLRAIFLRITLGSEWGDLDRRKAAKLLPPQLSKADHSAVRGETLLCMYRIGLRIDHADFDSVFTEHLEAQERMMFAKTLGLYAAGPGT